jgi:hypothetical protein
MKQIVQARIKDGGQKLPVIGRYRFAFAFWLGYFDVFQSQISFVASNFSQLLKFFFFRILQLV